MDVPHTMGMRYIQTIQNARRIELDAYDRKILFNLAQNCRTPATRIAKHVGLSRDSVRYRIARLESSGVIQGYRSIIDITAFGANAVHVLLQLNQPTPEAEKKLVETFKSYPFCRAVIKFNGKYDFDIALISKNMQDLDEKLTQIISDCGNWLQQYELLFLTKSFVGKTFPDHFAKMPAKPASKPLITYAPDKIDFKLLRIIADRGDIPLHELGTKLQLSADAAKYRLHKLLAAGIIKGFVPVINYDMINYNVYAILLNIANLTPAREATLAEFLRTNKDVLWAVKCVGAFNLMLYICTSDPDDLIRTTSALRAHFTNLVRAYETLINYEEYKYTYWPGEAALEPYNNL